MLGWSMLSIIYLCIAWNMAIVFINALKTLRLITIKYSRRISHFLSVQKKQNFKDIVIQLKNKPDNKII